jgi:hypothetical protein
MILVGLAKDPIPTLVIVASGGTAMNAFSLLRGLDILLHGDAKDARNIEVSSHDDLLLCRCLFFLESKD